jgi:hypothetical protein
MLVSQVATGRSEPSEIGVAFDLTLICVMLVEPSNWSAKAASVLSTSEKTSEML